ncbi:Alcohol dehydrogenase [NADP(+)] [Strongyloides ratti]|uniref:Alcohol dehydrogenase [NADP(+)] n=1 Tax=Strongyloides ratti TaxID=34506 RepID=A0A090LH61_STRRB|nr:Alcohol dehydrogenase [NADP(+)] [Strongyloides ratti]CEF66810.1 Alcohol dehydrogenase [NADP(+)] [Strongyloides ratti]
MLPALNQSIKLSNGINMPLFGLGTWQAQSGEIKKALKIALDNGYRLIDTAKIYGNEKEIGEVLKEYFSLGKLVRDDVFVTTKLWCTHNKPTFIESELKNSLKRLQLNYVDLYLVHFPTCFNNSGTKFDTSVTIEDTWRGMEKVYEKGLTKAIGVSNFSNEQIERIMKIAKIPIHNSQVEVYLYWPQYEHHECCKKYNISLTAYAPIGSPGRVNYSAINWGKTIDVLEDEIVAKMGKKYKKTPAQILLRHLIQREISVIPKSSNEQRIIENSQIFDFELSNDDMTTLNNISTRQRLFKQEFMIGHPEDSFIKER